MSHRERRTYDHRIKAQIIATGDPTLFPELGVPRSTAVNWIRRGVDAVVTFDDDSPGVPPFSDQVAELEHPGVVDLEGRVAKVELSAPSIASHRTVRLHRGGNGAPRSALPKSLLKCIDSNEQHDASRTRSVIARSVRKVMHHPHAASRWIAQLLPSRSGVIDSDEFRE